MYAQSTRSGGLQVRPPCSGPYLLDSLHAASFQAPRGMHGDILTLNTMNDKTSCFPSKDDASHRRIK